MSAGLRPFACAIRTIASSWRSVMRPLSIAPFPPPGRSLLGGERRSTLAGAQMPTFDCGPPLPFDDGRGGGAELAGRTGGVPGGPGGLAGAPARMAAPRLARGLSA